ncbi:unnamed protein product [Musa acuminata subsp. malaccensis]|uniref:(wild Malaysian banana) hypothetical protein n=1 Tax=Musa acuminata subsp. malaccensis TaxID=214687 RepID=A0A804J5H7_MUSAM|nr:unnamed protein product [Musa acuminata subsp. malaccensis]
MAAGRIISQQLLRKRHHIQSCIRECLHYNPCFSAVTTTPRVLAVTDDPVNATLAPDSLKEKGKDVVTFLSWATEPEMEERRLMGFKWIFVLSLLLLQVACYRRLNGSVLKSRKMALNCVS